MTEPKPDLKTQVVQAMQTARDYIVLLASGNCTTIFETYEELAQAERFIGENFEGREAFLGDRTDDGLNQILGRFIVAGALDENLREELKTAGNETIRNYLALAAEVGAAGSMSLDELAELGRLDPSALRVQWDPAIGRGASPTGTQITRQAEIAP